MTRSLLAVLAILLAVLGLRWVGLDFGAPHWLEADSYTALHVDELRKGRGSNPRTAHDTHYPHLIAQLTRVLPEAELPDPADYSGPLELREAHLEAASTTYVQVRLVVALLSLLVIPGTWFLARRFLCPRWSLFAVALCGSSLLFQCFAQQARPHAAAAALMLVSVLCAMRLRRNPNIANYVFAGGSAALAFGCLHSGVAVLIPLAVAYLARELPPGSSWPRRWFDPLAAIPLALVGLVVPVFYPFFLDEQKMAAPEGVELGADAVGFTHHSVAFDAFDGSGFATVVRSLWTWEPVLALLVGAALLVGLATLGHRRMSATRRGDLLVTLSFCLPYLIVIGLYAETYERFLLPLIPFLCVFAAQVPSHLSRAPAWRKPVAALAVAAVLVSGYAAARMAWVRTQPDTLEQVAAWLEQHAEPASEAVFVFPPPMDLPLGRDATSLGVRGERPTPLFSLWSKYQSRLEDGGPVPRWSMRWIVGKPDERRRTDDAAVDELLDRYGPGLYVVQVMTERAPPFVERMRAGLLRRGELLERFSPDPDPWSSDYPFFEQDELVPGWPHVFARLLRARAVGPVVEVFRVE